MTCFGPFNRRSSDGTAYIKKRKLFQEEASPLQTLHTMIILKLLFTKVEQLLKLAEYEIRELIHSHVHCNQLKVFTRLVMQYIVRCAVTEVRDKCSQMALVQYCITVNITGKCKFTCLSVLEEYIVYSLDIYFLLIYGTYVLVFICSLLAFSIISL
jgi:hypothetical protein